jgi:hypothetical protein
LDIGEELTLTLDLTASSATSAELMFIGMPESHGNAPTNGEAIDVTSGGSLIVDNASADVNLDGLGANPDPLALAHGESFTITAVDTGAGAGDGFRMNAFSFNVVPEPSTFLLAALGLLGLAACGRRRRR